MILIQKTPKWNNSFEQLERCNFAKKHMALIILDLNMLITLDYCLWEAFFAIISIQGEALE
jgi:hypothetical protein